MTDNPSPYAVQQAWLEGYKRWQEQQPQPRVSESDAVARRLVESVFGE